MAHLPQLHAEATAKSTQLTLAQAVQGPLALATSAMPPCTEPATDSQ